MPPGNKREGKKIPWSNITSPLYEQVSVVPFCVSAPTPTFEKKKEMKRNRTEEYGTEEWTTVAGSFLRLVESMVVLETPDSGGWLLE